MVVAGVPATGVGRGGDNGAVRDPATVSFASVDSPLGRFLVAVTEAGVVSTDFEDSSRARERISSTLWMPVEQDEVRVRAAVAQLAAYFAGDLREFTLPLDWRAVRSPSARTVLRALYETVPYGRVVTYGQLAERSGTGVPARGVGSIMGANPIPLIVPCHRVVAGDGLGGFSGGNGVPAKERLLALEGQLPATLF